MDRIMDIETGKVGDIHGVCWASMRAQVRWEEDKYCKNIPIDEIGKRYRHVSDRLMIGDKVEIIRGDYTGKEGIVIRADEKVYVSPLFPAPSTLILELNAVVNSNI